MKHTFENLMIEVSPGYFAGCFDGIAHIVRNDLHSASDWEVDRLELLVRDEDGEPYYLELGYEHRHLHDIIESALADHCGPQIEKRLARRASLNRWFDFRTFLGLREAGA